MRFFRKLRRRLPRRDDIESHSSLKPFRTYWKDGELWAFNRNSIALGCAIGIFSAFLPMPFEMVVAVFLAIMLRGNVIFASSLVWISNPITWLPLYTPCYLLGAKILQLDPINLSEMTTFKIDFDLGYHYVALWLGCLIIGSCLAIITYFSINTLWRSQVRNEWLERKKRRKKLKENKK